MNQRIILVLTSEKGKNVYKELDNKKVNRIEKAISNKLFYQIELYKEPLTYEFSINKHFRRFTKASELTITRLYESIVKGLDIKGLVSGTDYNISIEDI